MLRLNDVAYIVINKNPLFPLKSESDDCLEKCRRGSLRAVTQSQEPPSQDGGVGWGVVVVVVDG